MAPIKVKLIALPAIRTAIFCSDDEETGPTNISPTIAGQIFSVSEEASIGSSFGTVVAPDEDGDPLTFSIIARNTDDTFSINGSPGELTLAGILDFENTSSYSLSVQAADDVGLIKTLIDEIDSEYNIDTDRVYVAGSSLGGLMSFQLACQLSDRVTI